MDNGRKMQGIMVVVMLVGLAGSVSLFAESQLRLVAKPPKLNGGVVTAAPVETPVPAATQPAASTQPAAQSATAAQPAPQASPAPVQQAAPVAAPAGTQASPGSSVSRPKAGDATSAPVEVGDAAGSSVAADPTLVALGSLGASNLYFSYLTLGTVADGYVGGTYEPQVAISVANESIFMNTTARTNLAKLGDSPTLAKEDKDVVLFMVATYDVLINQAKALVQFISNQKDDGSSYQKYRTDAWKRIVELFGIK